MTNPTLFRYPKTVKRILDKYIPCDDCEGTGHIQFVRQIAEDAFVPVLDDDEQEDCKTCEGTGLVLKD